MKNIKFIGIGSSDYLFSHHCDNSSKSKIEQQSLQVLTQIKSMDLNFQERQSLQTASGAWHCTVDSYSTVFIVVTEKGYPQRQAFQFLQELMTFVDQMDSYKNRNKNGMQTQIQSQFLQRNLSKYETLTDDKLYKAQNQVNQVQSIMENNLKEMMNQSVQLDSLSESSDSLRLNANEFKKQADQVERIMYWRKVKLYLILGLAVITLLLVIILPLAL